MGQPDSLEQPAKVIGIIAEYNPFHGGHKFQIKEAKKRTGADWCVAAMSGDFVQRGEPAVYSKYLRTRMALSCGADLVVCDGNLSTRTIERLSQICDRPLYLDPVSTAWARELKPYIGCFDTIKPNRMELEVLSDCLVDTPENVEMACDIVRGKGVRRVFVSLGKDGMYYKGPEGGIWGQSRAFDGMVNATGAGDASMAGIIYATRQGYTAEDVLAFGMGAGMIAISSSDTISREMSPAAIENMVKEYIK